MTRQRFLRNDIAETSTAALSLISKLTGPNNVSFFLACHCTKHDKAARFHLMLNKNPCCSLFSCWLSNCSSHSLTRTALPRPWWQTRSGCPWLAVSVFVRTSLSRRDGYYVSKK